MRLNSLKILKIAITSDSRQKILEEIRKRLAQTSAVRLQLSERIIKPIVVVTPNPEQIVLAQKEPHFARLLNQADVALPDGIGLVFASRILNVKCQMTNDKWKLHRIPGVEFMEDLVKMAAARGFPIALIGGRDNLAVKAFECLQKKYPGLQGWAEDGPEVIIESTNLQINKSTNNKNNFRLMINIVIEQAGKDTTDDYFISLARKIRETNVQIVFVGLGVPKQEYFIEALSCQLSDFRLQKSDFRPSEIRNLPAGKAGLKSEVLPIILMNVGGSFDFIAGRVKRAPLLIRLIGFEWLWRLVREPWRWKRQLALPEFIRLVIKEKFKQK